MSDYTISVTFLDYWHLSSGLTGGAKSDSVVAKDANSLPYIPGKTLKGLLRESAENLGTDKSKVDTIFGKKPKEDGGYQEAQEGVCYFPNLHLQEKPPKELIPYLYHSIASTAIEANGLAKDKSLREIEVVVPLTLQATITCDEEHAKILQESAKLIKRMGLNRNRGLGRCSVVIEKKGEAQ